MHADHARALDVVNASYVFQGDLSAWMTRVKKELVAALRPANGILSIAFDRSGSGPIQLGPVDASGVDDKFAAGMEATHREFGPEMVARAYPRAVLCATVSEVMGVAGGPGLSPAFRATGFNDVFGLYASNPDGKGVVFAAPIKEDERPFEKLDRHHWSRVAVHVAAGLRLALAFRAFADGASLDGADAVFEPSGAVANAVGDAAEAVALERLRDSVRAIDEARVLGERDPEQALHIWRGLVAGEWSLVDRFDTDGRRYVVAYRNPPGTGEMRSLTPRERQVVEFACHGHSNDFIGYELGIATSTVATHLTAALKKLGMQTRVELIRKLGALTASLPNP